MYKKILVPLDGSELAEIAVPYAEGLAARLKAELILITVCPELDPMYAFTDNPELRRAGASQYLRRIAEELSKENIDVRTEAKLGHCASTIIDASEQEGADLIVIATHGRSGLARWVLGSTADKITRAATKPVLLIRAKKDQPDVRAKGIFNRILAPLDGSIAAESVLPHVEALAKEFGSELILFRAVPRETYVVPVGTEGAYELSQAPEELINAQLKDSREYLEEIKAPLSVKGFPVTAATDIGDPGDEIIEQAERHDVGLVAMCTHGRSGIDRWVYGSVATKVLNGGTTPLLLVRMPEGKT